MRTFGHPHSETERAHAETRRTAVHTAQEVSPMNVEIKTTEPQTVAFIQMHGEYSQIPDAMKRLYMWTGMRGMQPAGAPSAVYYTLPEGDDQSAAEWEVYTPVARNPEPRVADKKGRGVRRVEPMQVAATLHKGPYETIADTYYALQAWLTENGYYMAGAPEESYLSDPKDTAPEEYLTEVRFPIAKD
jgi:effector-binding domain-containing protein